MNPSAEAIPVRIAVAVDANGFWSAAGHCAYESDAEAAEAAVDYLPLESSPHRHVVWVEAYVPLAQSEAGQTVAGKIATA